jgi:hypothetical protein
LQIGESYHEIKVDLGFIKERMNVLREDRMMVVFHPNRVMRFYDDYGYNILEDEYILDSKN